MIAEKWIDQIVKYIETLKIEDDATHTWLATFQLRDFAEIC